MRVSGGVLNITVDQVQENSGEDNAINTRFAKISVRDSGLGISTVDKDKIFDAFFTTKPVGDGTGLGLSVVHGVVRSHLGRVEVNSAEGAGAEFVVYLPITELVENKTAESATEIATGHERVFFVDDDEMVARLALEVLQRYGYEVSVFTDPLQAFQRLQSEETCDLLITDLTMPTMNGVEFAKRVREIRPDLKIILCTGYDPSFSRSEDENLISARISKPFSLSDLLNTLRNVLDTEVEYSEQRDMAIGT